MKRLILCLDGTWNSADRIEKQTNIVRLRDMIAPISEKSLEKTAQFIYYDEGVGTGDFIDKFIGGGLGFGGIMDKIMLLDLS